jgi:hypothetical protein
MLPSLYSRATPSASDSLEMVPSRDWAPARAAASAAFCRFRRWMLDVDGAGFHDYRDDRQDEECEECEKHNGLTVFACSQERPKTFHFNSSIS